MRLVLIVISLFITCNVFAQIQGTGPNNQGNIPLHNLRHASGPDFIIRSGLNGKSEWVKDTIYFPKVFTVASSPLTAKKGDIWFSTANGNTYLWDGVVWQTIAKMDGDTSAVNELIQSVAYSGGYLNIEDNGGTYTLDLRDTLFGTIDTSGLVELIKNVAPIVTDTLFGTIDTTGLRDFVRNESNAIDKFSFFQPIGGTSALLTLGDGTEILSSSFVEDGVQIIYDPSYEQYTFKYYESDGIIGNETGRLRISNDTLYYKNSPDSLELAYKLPKIDSISWDSIKNKPLTFAPSTHTHVINDVAFLQDNLNLKSNVNHTHTMANITDRDTTFTRIRAVPNYDSLRSLSNYIHDIVMVNDWTYTGPDGNTYTTIGGLFKKASSGTENGGTIIAGNYIWVRDWDRINVKPEWWECGGFDVNGDVFTSINSKNGIYDDTDRLNSAFNLENDEIVFGFDNRRVVTLESDLYIIDNVIQCGIDFILKGNNATIKRKNSPVPTTTANLVVGGTTIQVTSTTGFRVGNTIMIQDVTNSKANSPFFGGKGYNEYEKADYAKITALTSTQITIDRTLATALPTGSVVIRDHGLLQSNLDLGNVIIENLKIDGNRDNGGAAYKFCTGNPHNFSISLIARSQYSEIRNCVFENCPAENIYMARGTINNCVFKGLNGSAVHMSADFPSAQYPQETKSTLKFTDNYVDGVCETSQLENNHNEGAFTYSAQSYNVIVTNNTFKNGGMTVFGENGITGHNSIYSDNICENFQGIMYLGSYSGSPEIELISVRLSNNVFTKCGDFAITPNNVNVRRGRSISGLTIDNNIFIDSRFYMPHVTNLKFTNNKLIFKSDQHNAFADRLSQYLNYAATKVQLNAQKSAIYTFGTDIQITGNTIENFVENNDTLLRGIWCDVESLGAIKDSSGANTKYFYSQNIDISNNNVKGFYQGVFTLGFANLGGFGERSTLNSRITQNNIYVPNNVSANESFGILGSSGFLINDNIIFRKGGNNQHGIRAYGVHVNVANLMGAKVLNNVVFGATTGNDILIGNSIYLDYNCIVRHNITMRPVQLNASKSYADGNLIIGTILPNMTSFEVGEMNFYELRKTLY